LALQTKAWQYLEGEASKEYETCRKAEKEGTRATLSGAALDYLYLASFSNLPISRKEVQRYFLALAGKQLSTDNMRTKARLAVVMLKAGRAAEAADCIASLKEHLVQTDERGAYFAFHETSYLWGMQPVSIHTAVMEALRLAGGNEALLDEMKIWLLKQKQTTAWRSAVATVDAVEALLAGNSGDGLLAVGNQVRILLDNRPLVIDAGNAEGYFKQTFTQGSPQLKAKSLTVGKPHGGIAYGAVYAQYRSPMAEVKASGKELSVEKKLYVEQLSAQGKAALKPVTASTGLAVGDKVVVRLTIRLDRAMDYVQLKDERAACFEPLYTLSGYRWNNGLGYYIELKDASTNFFFDALGKGVYVLEYSYRIARQGRYEAGLATVQSAYAPEYAAHSASLSVVIDN
jgi:hypothetical protein